jgi:hypothetical protein
MKSFEAEMSGSYEDPLQNSTTRGGVGRENVTMHLTEA